MVRERLKIRLQRSNPSVSVPLARMRSLTLLFAASVDCRSVSALVACAMAYARPRKLLLRCLALAAAAQATNWGGLRNQGNTCYLNSLLQTLFHVPALRSDVLGRPAEPRGLMKRLRTAPRPARALADVFKRLAQNATAQTRGLTRALGVSGLASMYLTAE